MTPDGGPRTQAGLGLWLAVSLLAHALALPLLRDGGPPAGRAGDGVRVTLVSSPRASQAAPASQPAVAAGDESPNRARDAGRRREARATRPPPEPEKTETVAVPVTGAPDPRAADTQLPRPLRAPGPATAAANRETPARVAAQAERGPAPRPESTPDVVARAEALPAAVAAPTPSAAQPERPGAAPRRQETADTRPDRTAGTPRPADAQAHAEPTAAERQAPEAATADTDASRTASAADGDAVPAPAAAPGDAAVARAGTAGALAASTDAGADAALLALLHRAIDEHKRYPSLARRQRREGVATVLFRLHPDGAMDRLELAASSGFDMLDKAALRAVAGVAPFAPAARYLQGERQFSVEVEFRLF